MKEIAILLTILLLLGCEETSSRKSQSKVDKAAQEAELKAVKTWCDSLSAAVGKFRIIDSTAIRMKKSQERMLPKLNYEKRREVYLTKDSLYVHGYPALSGENNYDDLPQLLKKKNYNAYMTDDLPDSLPWVVIFKATDNAKTEQLCRIVPHFKEAGYHYFAFVAKASDLPPLPSIPDSSYYNWIKEKLNNSPAARYATDLAHIAIKRFQFYPPLLEAFDAAANIPFMGRLTYLCEEFPPHVVGKEDKEKLLTLLYTKAQMYARSDALARTFKLEQGAKELILSVDMPMKELFEKLMNEEAIEIELKLEQ